jgi:glycosyltransferase involved in cell wall biosynthesis
MRIVHTESSCGWGGQEIRILTEARGMLGQGHDVCVLCPRQARIFEEGPAFGVPIVALPIARKSLSGILAIRRHLASLGTAIDVINTHSSTDTWLTALALELLPRCPALVRTRHVSAPVPNNFSTRWLYRRASTMVVTTGNALRDELIRINGLDPKRVVSIPTGIDLSRFRVADVNERAAARARLGFSPETFVVGIVATLRSWKGHRFLIEAIDRINRGGFEKPLALIIVGDGPQLRVMTEQIDALGLAACVKLAGNQKDVVPYLHALDAFALPSYANEGVPQALLQAMACGIPVVTTDAGAIAEIARDGSTALVVAKQDAAALAAAIRRLADDANLARALAKAARDNVILHHSLEGMVTAMGQVFRQALAFQREAA